MNLALRILPLFIVAVFSSCAPVKREQMSKNASDEFSINEELSISWPEVLKQNEPHYLVFFYSPTCEHCHEIMGDLLAFSEEEIVKTYFINTRNIDYKIPINSDVIKTIGVSSIDDLFIAGTPALIEVTNGEVTNNIPGKDECLTLLNELRLTYK